MSVKLSSLLPQHIKTLRLTLEKYDSSDAHVRCCLEARKYSTNFVQSGDQVCDNQEKLEWRHNVGRIAKEEFEGRDIDVDVFVLYVVRLDIDVTKADGSVPLIGFIAVHQRDESAPELGYNILPEFRGKGYATEAAVGLCRVARETIRIRRLAVSISPTNLASLRVAEKAGFVSKGRTKKGMDDGRVLNCYELPMDQS